MREACAAGWTLREWSRHAAAERRALLIAGGPAALRREYADGASANLMHVAASERAGALAAVRLFAEAIGAGWSDATLAERVSATLPSLAWYSAAFLVWYHGAYEREAGELFPLVGGAA